MLVPTGSSIHRIASRNVPPTPLLSMIGGPLAGPDRQFHSSHRFWECAARNIIEQDWRIACWPQLAAAFVASHLGTLHSPHRVWEWPSAPILTEIGRPLAGFDRQLHSSHRFWECAAGYNTEPDWRTGHARGHGRRDGSTENCGATNRNCGTVEPADWPGPAAPFIASLLEMCLRRHY